MKLKILIYHRISSGDDTSSPKFKIGASSGVIQTTSNPLDFEATKIYTLTLQLVDGTPGASGTKTGSTTVQVTVLPVNEHTPSFTTAPGNVNKGEDVSPGTEILTLSGADTDDSSTSHGQIAYGLISAKDMSNTDVSTKFRVDTSNGKVYTADFLDRETTDYYSLIVKVTDGGGLSATASFTVNVDDINEFTPSFTKAVYTANLAETAIAADATITTVTANDNDKTKTFTFSITGGDTTKFKQTASGNVATIKVNNVFDPDALKVETYTLVITATDQSTSAKTGTTSVIVTIVGDNDNTPSFTTNPYTHNMPESQTVGTLLSVVATDGDFGRDASLIYSEKTGSGDSNDFFGVSAGGDVYLKKVIDYDTMGATKVISFIVEAIDNGATKRTGSTTVSVTVTPVSDTIPSCSPPALSATVNENVAAGFTAATLSCSDDDSLAYSIQASSNTGTAFQISSSGVITVTDQGSGATALDWDNAAKPKIYNLVVDVTDGTNTINVPVAIALVAVNEDTTPSFASNPTVNVLEDRNVGFSVTTYAASDDDADPHNVVKYEINSVDPNSGNSLFQINQLTGEILVASPLDYEAADKVFKLKVIATDGGGSQVPFTLSSI